MKVIKQTLLITREIHFMCIQHID